MKLIGITGAARSGKDTAAAFLVEAGYVRVAFADAMKDMLRAGFGLTDEHLFGALKEAPIDWLGRSPRYLLQTLGTEWGRNHVGADTWLRVGMQKASQHPLAVISDVRFDNEARAVRDAGGVVIRLRRRSAPQVNAHVSEAGVSDSLINHTINNDGTLEHLRWAMSAVA